MQCRLFEVSQDDFDYFEDGDSEPEVVFLMHILCWIRFFIYESNLVQSPENVHKMPIYKAVYATSHYKAAEIDMI